jgi:hypothetical protein
MMEPHENRAAEMAALLEEHKARVALLPPQVKAHSLMPAPMIYQATQSNLVRAQGLAASCKAYAVAVEAMLTRHVAEEAEERGGGVHEELAPPMTEADLLKGLEDIKR